MKIKTYMMSEVEILKIVGTIAVVVDIIGLVLTGIVVKKIHQRSTINEIENAFDKIQLYKEQYRKGEQ